MSLSTHRQVRAAIVAVLQAIPDIGRVHDHQPFADRQADFQGFYQATLSDGSTQLRGWHVRRSAVRETSDGCATRVETDWRIGGYVALSEAAGSELVFDDLVDAVRSAFRSEQDLGGLVGGLELAEGQAGVQAEDLGPAIFAGVLCHEARLLLTTWQIETLSERARP